MLLAPVATVLLAPVATVLLAPVAMVLLAPARPGRGCWAGSVP